jgi:ubiquinone/menaquinone biosynthesis C-methylase UbiE
MESTDQSKTAVTVAGNSPERIYVTGDNRDDDNIRRHIARYEFASQFVRVGTVVLDCACGSGYGAQILAARAARVLGMDRCSEAIGYARRHHACLGVSYMLCEVEEMHLPLLDGTLDAVVTLETIEHLPPDVCRKFLAGCARWVKPGGVVVASSPMLRYRDGQPYVTSPYHINELPRGELLTMLVETFPMRQWVHDFFRQEQEAFLPLLDEHEGFCVMVARRRMP